MGIEVGSKALEVDEKQKYTRTAGFGGGIVRNDDFINDGLCSEIFNKRNI